jgi:hypothetical protein
MRLREITVLYAIVHDTCVKESALSEASNRIGLARMKAKRRDLIYIFSCENRGLPQRNECPRFFGKFLSNNS